MLKQHPQRTWTADVALVVVAVLWGVNIPVVKFAITTIDRFCFNAFRLVCSALILGALALRERRGRVEPPSDAPKASPWRVALFCFMSGGVYQATFVAGVDLTTAGNTALIITAAPMWAALIAWLFAGERLRRIAFLGLITTLAGTLVVTLQRGGLSSDQRYLVGNIVILIAVLIWAGSSVLSRSILQSISPTMLAFMACISTLPLHFLLAARELRSGWAELPDSRILMAVIYSGVFSTGVAYALWNYGVRQVGVSHAAIFQNLVPVVALFVAWAFLGEAPTSIQLVGGSLIIAGLLIMRRGR